MDYVETHAREAGLDPLLVMSVIRQGSLFGHFVVSDIGAVGVMQIIPPTARCLGMKTLPDLFLRLRPITRDLPPRF